MNSSNQFTDPTALTDLITRLRKTRKRNKAALKAQRPRRRHLNARDRTEVLRKTDGRCHICGGLIDDPKWQADHVLAHSGGGDHQIDNYLPAHGLCNNYRWDYLAEEFQVILKLGVWARTQIENQTGVGREMAARFAHYETSRVKRRKRR